MNIASLSPAVTEILYLLEVHEQIVCVDQFSNFPEAARDLPHVKDHTKVHPAELRDHGADLVFTSTVIQEQLAERLKADGFSVVHQDPRTLHDIYESIRSLGALLDVDAKAEELILQMQQGFNDVKRRAAHLLRRPKVYVEEWPDPPMASGNWVPEVAHHAGGQQFPIQHGHLSREVALEEVQKHDPDLIVISWCGAGALADASSLEQRSNWNQLRAVQEGNIRVIDDSLLNRPGPRLVEGCQRLYGWLFEMLH